MIFQSRKYPLPQGHLQTDMQGRTPQSPAALAQRVGGLKAVNSNADARSYVGVLRSVMTPQSYRVTMKHWS